MQQHPLTKFMAVALIVFFGMQSLNGLFLCIDFTDSLIEMESDDKDVDEDKKQKESWLIEAEVPFLQAAEWEYIHYACSHSSDIFIHDIWQPPEYPSFS